jgi:uncharacterized protein (DUF302 family)
MENQIGWSRQLHMDVDSAIAAATEALKQQGFGVLTEIDVKATLQKKLGVDHPRYTILGACNPSLAYKALQIEPALGLLLPCNVIVYDNQDGSSTVSIVNPEQMLGIVQNEELAGVAQEATRRLKQVLAFLTEPVVP